MSSAGGHYIHGTHPDEQDRLSLLNSLLNRGSIRALALRGGERVLDVGSGLGQLTRAIARAVGPEGKVVAVERDPEQLAEAQRRLRREGEGALVEFRSGEATALPLKRDERGRFDVAHCRFLLEHVPDPSAVVRSMVEAVRPGGRVVLEDDDHDVLRLWPNVPPVENLWRVYIETYAQLGNDPYVGRRLPELLAGAGAEPVSSQILNFGSCAGNPAFTPFVANFAGVLDGARQAMTSRTGLGDEDIDAVLEELQRWSRKPDAVLWYGTCWAEGRRPGGDEAPSGPTAAPTRAGDPSTLRFLADSARDLNSTLELSVVFEKIAARVHEFIDFHLFCVLLWNEESRLLEHSYSLRFGEHLKQEGGLPLGRGIGGTVALERRPMLVPNVREDPRYVSVRHTEVEIRSELAVPLVVQDRLVGVLDLESTEVNAFTEEHQQTLSTLASHIATALENARLFEKVRAEEQRLERDLVTARKIQRGLLPRRPPQAPGLEIATAFSPAQELSGDFYDFLPYGDGRLALAVGDVAGKATAAALYGSLAVGILRGLALERPAGPAETLRLVNDELQALEIERRFVAMLFGVYDSDRRILRLANAGLPQPLRVREGKIEALALAGLPLGGLSGTRYQEISLGLEPGDLIVVLSDGLEECVDETGEAFGEERIRDVIRRFANGPVAEVGAQLLAATEAFAGAAGAGDDRTVVVLRAT